MSFSKSIYPPLGRGTKSTRLLKLLPEQEDKIIRCTLTSHFLDDAPAFIGVSYVWGYPEPSHDIIVNGATLKVRENLWHALQQLVQISGNDENCISLQKKPDTKLPEYFWIDAICVNQNDISERGDQVDLMKAIYSTAHFVIAWIGVDDGEISLLFEYLRALKHTARNERNHFLRSQKRKFSFRDAKSFVSRPYWSRIWIVQEFTLARELWVLCGSAAVSWLSLQQFRPFGISDQTNLGFKHLSKQEHHYSIEKHVNGCRELSKLRRSWQMNPKRSSFTNKDFGFGARPRLTRLLAFCKDYHCTDPRDRVYGLLGLTEDEGEDRLLADYSITPFKLYHRVIFHLMQRGQKTLPPIFRDRLAEGLQICDHDDLPRSNFVYEMVNSRCVKRLLNTGSSIWSEQLLNDVRNHLDMTGNPDDPYEFYDWVVSQFETFPSEEDPSTWNQFDQALKKALQITKKMGEMR